MEAMLHLGESVPIRLGIACVIYMNYNTQTYNSISHWYEYFEFELVGRWQITTKGSTGILWWPKVLYLWVHVHVNVQHTFDIHNASSSLISCRMWVLISTTRASDPNKYALALLEALFSDEELGRSCYA